MSPSLPQDDATLAVRDRKWISKCIESLNKETAFLAKIVLIMFKESRKKKNLRVWLAMHRNGHRKVRALKCSHTELVPHRKSHTENGRTRQPRTNYKATILVCESARTVHVTQAHKTPHIESQS